MEPPDKTAAIVIDLRSNQGAIEIVDRQSDAYVDRVGTEEAGHTVMVTWKAEWWYYCLGTVRVGYIVAKD